MKLTYCLAVCVTLSLGVAVGCDDDRPLGDLGPGQDFGGSGSQAGEATTNGGGDAAAGQGAGGALPSAGGAPNSGGAGGAEAAECPTDFFEADGTACSDDGQICSDGASDPCGFGNSLICSGGEWQRQEAFPGPCGGAGGGGVGGADAGGAGGSP